jgi:hypothetical protein
MQLFSCSLHVEPCQKASERGLFDAMTMPGVDSARLFMPIERNVTRRLALGVPLQSIEHAAAQPLASPIPINRHVGARI